MEITNLLVIPNKEELDEYIKLANEEKCGFEYDDFFIPSIADNEVLIGEIIKEYSDRESSGGFNGIKTLHGAFLDVTIFSDDPNIVKASDYRIEQSIEFAKKMGAKGVVFHTNYIANFIQDAYRNNWVNRNANYFTQKANKYPELEFYLENMFDTDWHLLEKFGEATKDVANLGVCFDYAHAAVFGDEKDIEKWVIHLSQYVKHIHINDNDFVSDLHLAVGDGKIDWHQFKELYEKYMKDASVLIETSGIKNARRSIEFLKQL